MRRLHVIFTSVRMQAERTEPLVAADAYDARWDRYSEVVVKAIGATQSGLAARTHLLDGKAPVSKLGYGLMIDPAGACVIPPRLGDDSARGFFVLAGVIQYSLPRTGGSDGAWFADQGGRGEPV